MFVSLTNLVFVNIRKPAGEDMSVKFVILMIVILFFAKEDTQKYADITKSSIGVSSENGALLAM